MQGVVTGYTWLGSLLLLIVCLVSVSFWVWFHFYLAAQFTRCGSVGFSTVRFCTVFGSVLCCAACCGSWRAERLVSWQSAPLAQFHHNLGQLHALVQLNMHVCVCVLGVCVCVRCACDSVCVQVSLFAILCQWRTLAGSGCRTRHTEAMATMSVGFSWATASLLCSFYQREWVSVRLSKSVYTCVCGCVLKHFLCLLISHLFPFRYFELFSSASASAWN